MPEPRPPRLLHADLDAGLPDVRAEAQGRPLHVVWWSRGVPVGHDELSAQGLPPPVGVGSGVFIMVLLLREQGDCKSARRCSCRLPDDEVQFLG